MKLKLLTWVALLLYMFLYNKVLSEINNIVSYLKNVFPTNFTQLKLIAFFL